jgi:predicted ATP-dependent Lon-type protease
MRPALEFRQCRSAQSTQRTRRLVHRWPTLAGCLQVAFDAGAKRLLLPMASVKDIPTIPGELFAKFQTGFYADATDAVFKALGVG